MEVFECSICLESLDLTQQKQLPCGHIFHSECLKKIIKKVCPLRRRKIGRTEECDEEEQLHHGFGYSPLYLVDHADFVQKKKKYLIIFFI